MPLRIVAPSTHIETPVPEKSSRRYQATLVDFAGAVIALAAVQTLTLTLVDVESGTVINGRNAQNVKNANGGTVAATTGQFVMVFAPEDTVLVGTWAAGARQLRRATFSLDYGSGRENHEILFYIQDLPEVA